MIRQLAQQAKASPSDPSTWFELSRVLLAEGFQQAAREALSRGQGVSRWGADWVESGEIYELLGDRVAAIESYREAIRPHRLGASTDDISAIAYARLGQALFEEGDVKAALLSLQVANHLQPDDVHVSEALAKARVLAVELEGKTKQKSVDSPRSLSAGGLPSKYEDIASPNRLDPDAYWEFAERVESLLEAERSEEALDVLRYKPSHIQEAPEIYLTLGKKLLSGLNSRYAVDIYHIGIQCHPRSAELYLALAEAHMFNTEMSLAIEAYQQAISLEPQNMAAHRGIAVAYTSIGEQESSIRAFIKASALAPDNSEVRAMLAWAIKPERSQSPIPRGLTPNGKMKDQAREGFSAPVGQSSSSHSSVKANEVNSSAVQSRSSGERDYFAADLSLFPLTSLLQFLEDQSSSGTLLVIAEGGEQVGEISFLRGHVTWVCTEKSPSLRSLLQELSIELDSSVGVPTRDEGLQLQQLVQNGICPVDVLRPQLARSIWPLMKDLFRLTRGQVRFVPRINLPSHVDLSLCHPCGADRKDHLD